MQTIDTEPIYRAALAYCGYKGIEGVSMAEVIPVMLSDLAGLAEEYGVDILNAVSTVSAP